MNAGMCEHKHLKNLWASINWPRDQLIGKSIDGMNCWGIYLLFGIKRQGTIYAISLFGDQASFFMNCGVALNPFIYFF